MFCPESFNNLAGLSIHLPSCKARDLMAQSYQETGPETDEVDGSNKETPGSTTKPQVTESSKLLTGQNVNNIYDELLIYI